MKQKRVNPLVRHPLLRKGGPHRRTNKAERKAARQRLRREWSALSIHGDA